MTIVDRLEHSSANLASRARFLAPFIERMGNPQEYEYRGECNDRLRPDGECVCGHSIRYEFLVHHKADTAKTAILGSECICHFESIAPQLYHDLMEAVAALDKRLAEAKRKSWVAAQEQEIVVLKVAYDEGYSRLRNLYDFYAAKRTRFNWKTIPDWLYWGMRDVTNNPPEYQRPSGYIQWYKRNQKKIDELLKLTQNP